MQQKKILPFVLAVLFAIPGCSTVHQKADAPDYRFRQQINNREYDQILATLIDSCDRGAASTAAEECRENIEQVRRLAERSYVKREFAKAGNLYRLLQRGTAGMRPGGVSFDTAEIQTRIEKCSRMLTEEGLLRYREENLEEAISLWEEVLSFDPENKAVQKAIATASTQRKQLKTLQ